MGGCLTLTMCPGHGQKCWFLNAILLLPIGVLTKPVKNMLYFTLQSKKKGNSSVIGLYLILIAEECKEYNNYILSIMIKSMYRYIMVLCLFKFQYLSIFAALGCMDELLVLGIYEYYIFSLIPFYIRGIFRLGDCVMTGWLLSIYHIKHCRHRSCVSWSGLLVVFVSLLSHWAGFSP